MCGFVGMCTIHRGGVKEGTAKGIWQGYPDWVLLRLGIEDSHKRDSRMLANVILITGGLNDTRLSRLHIQ